MRYLLLVAFVAGGSTAFLNAQGGAAIDPAVMTAQTRFHEAQKMCNAGAIGTMVTDDMLFLHADGRIEDKKAFTDFVSKCVLEDIRFDVKTARRYGDVVVLTGTLPFKIKQGPSLTFLVSQVYVNRNGSWLLASHQSTSAAGFGAPQK